MLHVPSHLNERALSFEYFAKGGMNAGDFPARTVVVAGGWPIQALLWLEWGFCYGVGFAGLCSSGRNRLKTDPLQPGFSVLRSVSDP